jgi:hypothetical protein
LRSLVWGVLALPVLAACSSEPATTANVIDAVCAPPAAVKCDAQGRVITEKAEAAPEASAPPEPSANWSYRSDRDEMRNTTSHFASVSSENVLSLGFPYDAENARLVLRKRPSDGLSVMLNAPGQFLCRSYDDDTVAVKFDDGPIQRFTCAEPDDASTGTIFINSEARFVEKLKSSKRLIVEAQMYQAGPQQMTFNVEGLEWPPKSPAAPGNS